MKVYIEALFKFPILLTISSCGLVSGYLLDTLWVFIISFFLLWILISETRNDINREKQKRKWSAENEGKLFFCYPTVKKIQLRIEKEIHSMINPDIGFVKYDGPRIVGSVAGVDVLFKIKNYDTPLLHRPCIIQIKNNSLEVVLDLSELMDMDHPLFFKNTLLAKLRKHRMT